MSKRRIILKKNFPFVLVLFEEKKKRSGAENELNAQKLCCCFWMTLRNCFVSKKRKDQKIDKMI